MPLNEKLIQINGPFSAGENVFSILKNKYDDINFTYIQRIGISSKTGHTVVINGQDFEIGKTGMLEFNDVGITSLYFRQEEDFFTIIDCIVV